TTLQQGSALSIGGTTLSTPSLVTDSAGNMTSAWLQDGHLMTRAYSAAAGTLGNAVPVDTAGGGKQIKLAAAAAGGPLNALGATPGPGSTYNVYAALGDDGIWNAPITLRSNVNHIMTLQAAVSDGGMGAVASCGGGSTINVARFSGGALVGTSSLNSNGGAPYSFSLCVDGSGNTPLWPCILRGLRGKRFTTSFGTLGSVTTLAGRLSVVSCRRHST